MGIPKLKPEVAEKKYLKQCEINAELLEKIYALQAELDVTYRQIVEHGLKLVLQQHGIDP